MRHDVNRAGATEVADERDAASVSRTRSIGNAALARSLDDLGIRRRATIGTVDDPAEHQADTMADHAMAMLGVTAHAPRPAAVGAVHDELGGTDVADDVQQALSARRGGAPLDVKTRSSFEGAYGVDLGAVRVHTDGDAAALSSQVRAEAFTHGTDVYFASGRFQPGTAAGQHLLAHELAHVAQDSGGAVHRTAAADVVRRVPWGKKRREKKRRRQAERGHREMIADKISGGDEKNDASRYQDIQQRFADQLQLEKDKVAEYLSAGDDKEEAETKAYSDAWEDDQVPDDLKKLAPMRKTRSEQHARKVDSLFSEMGARERYKTGLKETAAKGTIVHKPIAKLIDRIEEMTASFAESAIARKVGHETKSAPGYVMDPEDRKGYYETARRVATREVLASKGDDKWAVKYKELHDSIKDEAHERSRARIAAQKLLDDGRSDEGKAADGVDEAHKDAKTPMTIVSVVDKVQSGGSKATTKILGKANKDAGRTTLSKANKGTLTVDAKTKFTPEEQAQGMLGGISSGLSSVASVVTGVQAFVKHIQLAAADGSAERDPGAMIAIIREGLALLKKPFAAAKSGMDAAKSFSGGQWVEVAKHIPVMDIVTSSIAIASDITDLVGSVMQWSSNRIGILAAKKDGRSELLDAIKRLKMRSATFIGKAVKHLIDNALSLGSTIATIVTGGLAAPVKAGLKAVGIISSAGEKLFDHAQAELIARKTQKARGHYTEKLTGSAEERFRNDAKVSIGGLIVAATGNDQKAADIARDVLGEYGSFNFDSDRLDASAVLNQVLDRMGDEADPMTHKEQLDAKLAQVKHMRRGVMDTYQDAKNVRDARNAAGAGGKTNRGPFYVLREVLRNVGDRRRIDRKMAQTEMAHGTKVDGTRAKRVRAREAEEDAKRAEHTIDHYRLISLSGSVYDMNDAGQADAILDAVKNSNMTEIRKELARLSTVNARNPKMLELLDKIGEAANQHHLVDA